MGNVIVIALVSALLVLSGCTRRPSQAVVARVGTQVITEGDVTYRNAVVRAEQPDETRDLGQEQLCRALEMAEMLRRHGRPVTDEMLAAEAQRIEKNSRDVGTLRRIQAIFGDDTKSYLRVYVLPVLVWRVAPFEFFPNDPVVQGETRLRAEKFLARAVAEPSFFFSKSVSNNSRRSFDVSERDGLRWKIPPGLKEDVRTAGDRTEGDRWLAEALPTLRRGQVFRRVVDMGGRWIVARYAGATRGVHHFDAVLFDKGDFTTWLEADLSSTPDARCVAPFTARSR